jgi:hypothetical protein
MILGAKRKRRKLRRALTKGRPLDASSPSETDFRGPNVNKRRRKPDEIYGDTSIPDSARRE